MKQQRSVVGKAPWVRAGSIGIGALLATTALVISMGASAASEEAAVSSLHSAPKVPPKVLVVVGNGQWRSVDGSIMKGGLKRGNGIFFQRETMKRTDAEIAQKEQEAIAFFQERYGLDVLHGDGSYIFTDWELDQGNNPRAYTVSGEDVPPSGWPIRMGGWGVFVTADAGLTLGGKFDGVHVPRGAAIIVGEWNYKKIGLQGEDLGELIIAFQMVKPAVFNQFGSGALHFKVFNEQFGYGNTVVHQNITFLDDNLLLQQDARNVTTFPAIGVE